MPKIVKTIDLANINTSTTSISYANLPQLQQILWDATAYDGNLEIYFEACIFTSDASYTAYAALFDVSGNQVTGSEVSTTSQDSVARVRSPNIYANLVSGTEYILRFKTAGATASLTKARLIIIQSGTITKTETVIDIRASQGAGTGTTYAQSSARVPFYFDSSQYDGTVNIFVESCMRNSSGSNITYLRLVDSAGVEVVGSEITTSATSQTRIRSAAIALANGETFEHQARANAGTGYWSANRIIIRQTNFTKTESVIGISNRLLTSTSTTSGNSPNGRFFHNDADWSGTHKNIFYESVYNISNALGLASAILKNRDMGSDDVIFTSSSTDLVRNRSTEITLINNLYDSYVKTDNSSYTVTHNGSRFIIQTTIPQTTTQTVTSKARIKQASITKTIQAKAKIEKYIIKLGLLNNELGLPDPTDYNYNYLDVSFEDKRLASGKGVRDVRRRKKVFEIYWKYASEDLVSKMRTLFNTDSTLSFIYSNYQYIVYFQETPESRHAGTGKSIKLYELTIRLEEQ